MKICPKCKIEFEDKFAFCKKCGDKLETKEEKLVCPSCGKEIQIKGGFCPFCGKSISEQKKIIDKHNQTSVNENSKSVQSNNYINDANTGHSGVSKKMVGIIISLLVVAFGVMYFGFRDKLYDIGILEPSTAQEQWTFAHKLEGEKNFEDAFKWYKKAAEQGHEEAQYMVSDMYLKGKGVKQNNEEAFKWMKKAAEGKASSSEMQGKLGTFYHNGIGVQKDYTEALKWFKKAADNGNVKSQVLLGLMYKNGEGTDINYEEAIKWLKKASDSGDKEAQKYLEETKSLLDASRKDKPTIQTPSRDVNTAKPKNNNDNKSVVLPKEDVNKKKDSQTKQESNKGGISYVGNRSNGLFHYLSCQWASRIPSYQRVGFSSRVEATSMGFRPCRVCRP